MNLTTDTYEAPSLTFKTDLEGFKKLVKDFVQLIPGSDMDQLDNGFKMVALAYLGLDLKSQLEEMMAVSTMDWASKRHLDAVLAVTFN